VRACSRATTTTHQTNHRVGCPRGHLESLNSAAAATFRSQNLSLPKSCARREFNRGETRAGSAGGSKLHLFHEGPQKEQGFNRKVSAEEAAPCRVSIIPTYRSVIRPNSERGGSSEQHAKAGEQSHKKTSGSGSKESGSEGSTRGGSSEQQAKAGAQSHKKTSGSGSKESGSEGSTRGGSHEQHVKAGQQSHKNS
jgi:hypothetical protein